MKRIKICHITTSAQIGGTEKTIAILLKQLPQDQFSQSLIILHKNGNLNQECDLLKISHIALNMKSILHSYKLFKVIKFIRKEKPDILISYLFHSNIIARVIGKLCGIKTIICGQRNIDPWRKWCHILLDRWTAPLCNKIISNSYAGKQRLVEIEKIPEEKIEVIYNGVEIPEQISNQEIKSIRKKYNIKENETLLLCPASFQKKKGHLDLLNAFSLALKENNNIKLILAGDGEEEQRIIEKIKKLRITKKVILTGIVRPLISLIQASDIIILASHWEGIPNTILEALACKKPIIATDVGGISEIITDKENGILVAKQNISNLSSSLLNLINNVNLKKQLSNKGYQLVKDNFSKAQMVKSFELIINNYF